MPAGIALGSNLGESKKILFESIAELRKIHCGTPSTFHVSSLYETDPVDCLPGTPVFLNGVIELETELSPLELLDYLRTMEIRRGRPFPHEYHAPRTLDLDLLYYDALSIETPTLQLPHPRIRERTFVLKPLVEIAPSIILPGWKCTAKEYLQQLESVK